MPREFSLHVTTAADVMIRIMGDEAMILNLKSELYLGLDAVGTRTWSVLHSAPTIEDAYELLLNEFDVEPRRLREDMDEFLDQLLEQGLIELAPGEALAG